MSHYSHCKYLAISCTLIITLKLQCLLALVPAMLRNGHKEIHLFLYHKLVSLLFDNIFPLFSLTLCISFSGFKSIRFGKGNRGFIGWPKKSIARNDEGLLWPKESKGSLSQVFLNLGGTLWENWWGLEFWVATVTQVVQVYGKVKWWQPKQNFAFLCMCLHAFVNTQFIFSREISVAPIRFSTKLLIQIWV